MPSEPGCRRKRDLHIGRSAAGGDIRGAPTVKVMFAAADVDADALSFFFLLGAAWFLMFGFIALCRPPESRRNEHSDGMVRIARVMCRIGLAMMGLFGVLWFVA